MEQRGKHGWDGWTEAKMGGGSGTNDKVKY